MATPNEIHRKSHFVFRDALFVDLGAGARFPRAFDSELRALLLPKNRNNSPTNNTKDETARYYEAQLIHYGLKSTKNKNAAKLRLTQALVVIGREGIKAPVDIRRLEEEMKAEWMKEVRRAKKDGAGASRSGGQKRKTVDGYEDEDNHAGDRAGRGLKARVTVDLDVHDYGTPTSKTASNKFETQAIPPRSPRPYGPSQNYKDSDHSFTPHHSQTRTPAARYSSLPYNPRQRDDDDDDAPPSYDSHDFIPYNSPPPRRSDQGRFVQLTGHYDMSAYTIDNGESYTPSFVLTVDKHNQALWGSIAGPDDYRCVIWGQTIEYLSDGDVRVAVQWRAESRSRGEYLFRRSNEGVLTFDGAGGLRGTVYGLLDGEDVELEGDLTHSYGVPGVEDMRGEWDAIARRAYGRR